jgi:hypothetical protein
MFKSGQPPDLVVTHRSELVPDSPLALVVWMLVHVAAFVFWVLQLIGPRRRAQALRNLVKRGQTEA